MLEFRLKLEFDENVMGFDTVLVANFLNHPEQYASEMSCWKINFTKLVHADLAYTSQQYVNEIINNYYSGNYLGTLWVEHCINLSTFVEMFVVKSKKVMFLA